MTIKERINNDFMEAYKSKDMEKKNFLGVLKGSIQTQEGKQIESTDENVLKVIKAMEKGLNETVEGKAKMGMDVSKQKLELSYLKVYMPEMMSDDEVRLIVKEILSREGVNKNQGFLMGIFNKEQKGKGFDNKAVSRIIMEEIAL
jgi:uncharacterized protein YqeY